MTMAVDDARPTALEAVAGAMAATMAPVRDVWLLEQECAGLAAHVEAAAAASDRLAEGHALVERELGLGRLALPGSLGLSVPPDLGRTIRATASRLGEDAAALAIEALASVFVPDSATGETLLGAVLDREAS